MSDDSAASDDDFTPASWSVDALGSRYDAVRSWSSSIDLLNRQPIFIDLGDILGPVRSPDGAMIEDRYSSTGYLVAPAGKTLAEVAEAGRTLGAAYKTLSESNPDSTAALSLLFYGLGVNLGHAGTFDYQREGSYFGGYTQHREFRDISNVNVGLFAQQAGLTKEDILSISGSFARVRSSNASPSQPYSLDPRTKYFIDVGYDMGASGVFGQAVQPRVP